MDVTVRELTSILKRMREVMEAGARPCTTCGKETEWLCSFCLQYKAAEVPLCENPDCREAHENKGECARKPKGEPYA
jgi:hypothetical protein